MLDDGASSVDGSPALMLDKGTCVLDDEAVGSEVEDPLVLDTVVGDADVEISVAEICGTSVLDKASVEPLDERLTGKGVAVMTVTNGRKEGIVAVAFAKGAEELKMLDKEADCSMDSDALLLDTDMLYD